MHRLKTIIQFFLHHRHCTSTFVHVHLMWIQDHESCMRIVAENCTDKWRRGTKRAIHSAIFFSLKIKPTKKSTSRLRDKYWQFWRQPAIRWFDRRRDRNIFTFSSLVDVVVCKQNGISTDHRRWLISVVRLNCVPALNRREFFQF